MFGIVEDGVDVPALGDYAKVHNGHIVGHLGDHAEVVGDEHDRHAQLILQPAHELQDLGLGRHVQGRGGLVGDQQAGVAERAMAIMALWRMPPESWKG